MDKKIELVDVVLKAAEYERTKSITTACDACKMLLKWNAQGVKSDEQ